MGLARIALISLLLAVPATLQAASVSFVIFPKASRLVSPSGRFVVESREREGSASQYIGMFHSLWLTDVATGRSRKLLDYIGLAAVSWSSDDWIVITEYLSKKTSRAMVIAVARPAASVVLDVPALIQMIVVDWRDSLRANDHIFVEAAQLDGEIFHFRVWGYGQHDPNGFHWDCEYSMPQERVACLARSKTTFDK